MNAPHPDPTEDPAMRSHTSGPRATHGPRRHRVWEAFTAYVMSRRLEHWVMFFAGAVAGAILG